MTLNQLRLAAIIAAMPSLVVQCAMFCWHSWKNWKGLQTRNSTMLDLIFIGVTVLFFAAAGAYVYACGRL